MDMEEEKIEQKKMMEVEQVESKLLEMSMKTIVDIPNDIIFQILSRLPGKSLLQFRWACKYWFYLIKDPSFAKLQLINHSINNPLLMLSCYNKETGSLVLSSLNCMNDVDDDHCDSTTEAGSSSRSSPQTITGGLFKCDWKSCGSKVLSSCNGLVCILRWTSTMDRVRKDKICVWNPCTNEFKESPVKPIVDQFLKPMDILDVSGQGLYGFGYDQTIDDYKVISNKTFLFENRLVTVVHVYTLGTNSWKRIGNYHLFLLHNFTRFVRNGASFYCKGNSSLGPDYLGVILRFDIAKEEYREISKPWFVDELSCVWLIELNGSLCIVKNAAFMSQVMEVWVVKDYYHADMNKNDHYSWTKLFTVRQPRIIKSFYFNPLGIFNKNGGEILIKCFARDLAWYNEKDDEIRKTRSLKVCLDFQMVEAYVESLVSLNSGTYMGHEEEEEEDI